MKLIASTLVVGLLGAGMPLANANAQTSAPLVQADWHGDHGGWHHGWHHHHWHHWHHRHYWHHHWAPPPPRVYGYYAPRPPGYAYGYVYTN